MRVRHYDAEAVPRNRVRPDLTRGVEGIDLLPVGMSARKAVLTRVAPRGEFLPHCDSYHHVLVVLQGIGEVCAGEETFPLRQGTVVEIPAGERHSYHNAGGEDLIMITLNVSEK